MAALRFAHPADSLRLVDLGPMRGYVHPWHRQRRTIDEQLTGPERVVRRVRLPQITVELERRLA